MDMSQELTTGGGAISIVMVWGWAFVSDYFQTRWLVVMAQAVIGFIPSIILAIWNVPLGAKYFACESSRIMSSHELTGRVRNVPVTRNCSTYLRLDVGPESPRCGAASFRPWL